MYFVFSNPLVFTVISSASSLSSLLEDSELKTLDSSPGFYVDHTVTVRMQNEQKQNKGLYSENVEIIHLTILEPLLFSSILTMKARKQYLAITHPEQDGALVIDVHTNVSKNPFLKASQEESGTCKTTL